MNYEFSWDDAKNETNKRKHGVSFEIALQAFDDPNQYTKQDRVENGEYRWSTLGMVKGMLILFIAHTVNEHTKRERISVSFQHEQQRKKKRRFTMATYIVKDGKFPPLTAEQEAEIRALAQKKDEDIDLSDIPELPEEFWENAERGKFYRPKKQQITINIDADVIAWLKSNGKGYQTRLNAILREKMVESISKTR